jgi:hypothetical protein
MGGYGVFTPVRTAVLGGAEVVKFIFIGSGDLNVSP